VQSGLFGVDDVELVVRVVIRDLASGDEGDDSLYGRSLLRQCVLDAADLARTVGVQPGKARCQECGSTFVVASRRQGHLYYRCASQVGKRAKRCRAVQI
jgi:hypothetical protein